MRLWHQFLIPYLDNKRLLGQHRECCALRGKGWGKKHSVVDYVFKHDIAHLHQYHLIVMHFMVERGYSPCPLWYVRTYRGQHLEKSSLLDIGEYVYTYDFRYKIMSFDEFMSSSDRHMIYPEHDDKYLKECLLNLKDNGAQLRVAEPIESMLLKLDLKYLVE